MKRIILVLMMIVLTVQAEDKCKIIYDMAHIIMENRQNGIPAIDNPNYISSSSDSFMNSDDLVVGFFDGMKLIAETGSGPQKQLTELANVLNVEPGQAADPAQAGRAVRCQETFRR